MFNHNVDKVKPSLLFNGNYRGEVVDVADPLNAGRIRVKVYGVFDELPDDHIPWAIYADPFMGGGLNSGGFWIPDQGDHVWVFFENGNHMYPVFFAGAPAKPHMPAEKTASEYPKNRVFKSKQGHVIEVDDTAGAARIRIHHKSGSEIVMFENGDVTELIVGNHTRTVKGNAIEIVDGKKDIHVSGNLDLKGARIDLNS